MRACVRLSYVTAMVWKDRGPTPAPTTLRGFGLHVHTSCFSDVKDRAVLKLHECRPNSPPPTTGPIANQVQPPQQPPPLLSPPTEHRRVVSPMLERAAIAADPTLAARASPRQQLANELRSAAAGYQPPHHYNQHQSSSMSDDMNYFSEPEFDASGDYRLRKSSSTSNYCSSPAYQLEQRRHYGTIDRYFGAGSGLNNYGRSSYRGHQPPVPPKPERHFGPGVPSGGRTSMRRSQSPPRAGAISGNRPAFGK